MSVDRLIRGAGVDLHVVDSAGDGAPLVFVHGLAGSAREWARTAAALPEYRTLAVDQRGHGFSGVVGRSLRIEILVEDLLRVLDWIGEPATVAGQSMGGHVAMLAAARRSDAVERLVLLEAGVGGEAPDGGAGTKAFFRSWPLPFADLEAARAFLGDGPLATEWLAALVRHPDGYRPPFDPPALTDLVDDLSVPRWSEWEQVDVPTLLVFAAGGMFTADERRELTRRNPKARRHDLIAGSHDAHLDATDEWIASLREFLLE